MSASQREKKKAETQEDVREGGLNRESYCSESEQSVTDTPPQSWFVMCAKTASCPVPGFGEPSPLTMSTEPIKPVRFLKQPAKPTTWPELRKRACHQLGMTQSRLDAQLHCTARMIGSVLNLRPPDDVETDSDDDVAEEVTNSRQNSRRVRIVHTPSHDVPLSQHLKQEVEAFPFPEKLDEFARMKTARRFVKNTYKLAETFKFMSLTAPDEDVNLAEYANIKGFLRGQNFRRRNRSVEHKFHVGEIAQRASESIALKTFKWLQACDHLMCTTFGDFGDSDEGRDRADSDVRILIGFLSEKIAGHATLDSTLSVQLLESRARAEVVRNQGRAQSNGVVLRQSRIAFEGDAHQRKKRRVEDGY